MVKTYQLSKVGEYGTSLKIAPVTTEKVTNEDTCLQVNGSAILSIRPQSILPLLSEFKVCTGLVALVVKMVEDKSCRFLAYWRRNDQWT